jgi:hypothetical protein
MPSNARPGKASHTKAQTRLSIRVSRTRDAHQYDRRRRAADLTFEVRLTKCTSSGP